VMRRSRTDNRNCPNCRSGSFCGIKR